MSDDNSKEEKPSIRRLLESWLIKYGEESKTKGGITYYKIEIDAYEYCLNALLQTLLSYGYGEDHVYQPSLIKDIQKVMTPGVHDTHKLNSWKDAIEFIWTQLLTKEFGDEGLIKEPKIYAKKTPRPKLVVEGEDDPVLPPRPTKKLDLSKFEGYGYTEPEIDEDFVKILEALKNE